MPLSKSDLNDIKNAIKDGQKETVLETVSAVREMFVSVGIDISNPIKVQSEMAFLSKAAKLADSIVSKVVLVCVAIFGAIAIAVSEFEKTKN